MLTGVMSWHVSTGGFASGGGWSQLAIVLWLNGWPGVEPRIGFTLAENLCDTWGDHFGWRLPWSGASRLANGKLYVESGVIGPRNRTGQSESRNGQSQERAIRIQGVGIALKRYPATIGWVMGIESVFPSVWLDDYPCSYLHDTISSRWSTYKHKITSLSIKELKSQCASPFLHKRKMFIHEARLIWWE
jgi:hypothetical protein